MSSNLMEGKALNRGGHVICLMGLGFILIFFQNCSKVQIERAKTLAFQKTVILKANYCPTEGFNYKNVFAYSRSAHLEKEIWKSDFDRDGLTDEYENKTTNNSTYNISSKFADLNADGYSDFAVAKIGYDQLAQKNLRICAMANQDTDNDGLYDCDEEALKLDELKFDTDGDGITDYLEMINHLNPNEPNDAYEDNDFDGKSNMQEVQMNTAIDESNTKFMNERTVQYSVSPIKINEQDCFSISAGNLPIMNVSNGNRLQLMVTEKSNSGQDNLRIVTLIVPANTPVGMRVIIDEIRNQIIDVEKEPTLLEKDL